jgi:DNA-binding NtrC family response regulator
MVLRILVVDDDPILREIITEVLTDEGHDITGVDSAEEALEALAKDDFPLVLSDLVMRKLTGLDLLAQIKKDSPQTLVVIMTSYSSLQVVSEALDSGAFEFLIKPFETLDVVSDLVKRAETAISQRSP